jgi:hypothetical protein
MLPLAIVGGMALAILAAFVLLALLVRGQRRQARHAGYPSLGAYLGAAPKTDEEKRAAADLALKGVVICALGLLFGPLLLVGLFPFFYGARKLLWAWMGLGLIDDPVRPEAGHSH